VTGAGLCMLVGAPALEILDISSKAADDTFMLAIGRTRVLKTLRLIRADEVTDDGLRELVNAPALTSVTLEECGGITDEGVRSLADSHSLTTVTVIRCRRISSSVVESASTERMRVRYHSRPHYL
jgi:hypothetical protein